MSHFAPYNGRSIVCQAYSIDLKFLFLYIKKLRSFMAYGIKNNEG